MKLRQLTDKVTHQWPAKVICLTIAIFLYVFHQASLIDKKTFSVPLTIIENGTVIHVGNFQRSVSVIVRTNGVNMKNITTDDMKAFVNIDNITEKGTYELPVHIELSDQLMSFDPFEIRLKQNNVYIEVDKKAIKYVDIEPSIVGNVAHGYKIESVTVDPSTMLITGPESIVNSTQNIFTSKVTVTNAVTNFTVEANYQPVSNLIFVENEGPYKVTIVVAPEDMIRIFDTVYIEVLNLPEQFEIEGGIPVISLTLSGKMPILEKYILSKHIVQIDCSSITQTGTFDLPLIYNIPGNLAISGSADEKISINVVEKVIENKE